MTFAELLERYRSGTAAEDERTAVEQELEKYQAIGAYLDEEWAEPLPQAPMAEFTAVKRSLRRRNAVIVLTCLLLTAAMLVGAVQVGLPALEATYFDPTVTSYSDTQTDLELALWAYYGLFAPEQTFVGIQERDTGFARWDLELSYFSRDTIDRMSYRTALLEKGTFSFPTGTLYFIPKDHFDLTLQLSGLQPQDSEWVTYFLRDIPETASVFAAVTFTNDLSAEEILALNRSGIRVHWMGVRVESGHAPKLPLAGLRLDISRVDTSINEHYPCFYLNLTHDTPENLQTHFESRLRYCMDYEAEVQDLGIITAENYYEQALAYVAENGIQSYGAYVVASPEELRQLAEDGIAAQILPVEIWPYRTHGSVNHPSFGG